MGTIFRYVFKFLERVSVSFFVDKKHFTRNNGMCRERKMDEMENTEKKEIFLCCKAYIRLCTYYYSVGSVCIAFQGNINELLCCTCTKKWCGAVLCETPNVETQQGENSIQSCNTTTEKRKKIHARVLLRFAC